MTDAIRISPSTAESTESTLEHFMIVERVRQICTATISTSTLPHLPMQISPLKSKAIESLCFSLQREVCVWYWDCTRTTPSARY